jgi:hypothetical protein
MDLRKILHKTIDSIMIYHKKTKPTPFLQFQKASITFVLLVAVLSSLLSPDSLISLLSCRFQIL